jgi:tetratricopeptide (TPR) repeat protein
MIFPKKNYLILLFMVLATPCLAQVSQTASVENLANVSFNPDFRLFAVMAALNAAGYDYEAPGREMSEVRKRVREDLKRADAKTLAQLRAFYQEHSLNLDPHRQVAAYISLGLLIDGPPDFKLAVSKKDMPDDVLQIAGFEEIVKNLHASVDLTALWRRYEASYTSELARYRPVLVDVIRQTLAYFRIPPRIVLDRQIVVIPDLLGPQRLVNARNMEKSYFIVLGPALSPEENREQLQHEYLHFLLDPLIAKFGTPLLKHEELLDLAQSQPHIRSEYQNRYLMVVAESLVEALILRLNPRPEPDREMVGLFRRGLIFTPYFLRVLQLYEEDSTLSLPGHVETIFADVDAKTVRADERRIAELSSAFLQEDQAKATLQREEQQQRLKAAHLTTVLTEAQDLIRQERYDAASSKLEGLLKQDPTNAVALFYLAQIAAQKQDYVKAFGLYRQADASPEATASIRAWSRLRMANYLASQGRWEEARERFNQVIGMEGELDGAREQAQNALEQLRREEQ